MSLQEVFYLVAIIFMAVMTVVVVIIAVMMMDGLSRARRIMQNISSFVDSATEKGHHILNSAEEVIPKMIEAISIGKHIKELIKEWKKK